MRGPLDRGGRVLVRMPSWLGDAVAVEPAVAALAARVGEQRLSLALPAALVPLFEGWLPDARRIAHTGRGGEDVDAWRGHELAVLLTGSFRSAWTARRAGIGERVGWSRDGRGWLLTRSLRPALERGRAPVGIGRVGGFPRVLPRSVTTSAIELLGLLGISVARTVPRLPVSERAVARVASALGDAPYVLANVGGRPDSAKAWAPEAWIEALTALMRTTGLRVCLVCGPGEEARRRAIEAGLQAGGVDHRVAFEDRPADLPELTALASRSVLMVTTDSGPRHVARAVGTPTVTLFGPTDPRHTLAAGGLERCLRVDVDCGPCHRERCELPVDQRLACMTRIEPARVAEAAQALLSDSAVGARRSESRP